MLFNVNNLFVNAFAEWVTGFVLAVCFGIRELAVVLVSMVPVIELKGGVVIGVKLGLGFWQSFWLSFLGSSFVCLPLLLLLPLVFRWRLFRRIKAVFESKAKDVSPRWRVLGVFIFSAIPVPGMGVYTSCVVAVILGLGFWQAAAVIISGNLVAGGMVVGLAALIGERNLDLLLIILFALFIILLAWFVIKVFTYKDEQHKSKNIGTK